MLRSIPSRAWNDLSEPKSFKAMGWSGPKTSPDASCHNKARKGSWSQHTQMHEGKDISLVIREKPKITNATMPFYRDGCADLFLFFIIKKLY